MIRKIIMHLLELILARIDLYALIKERAIKEKKDSIWNNIRYKGRGIKLNGDVHISSPQYMVLGNNVHIGDGAYIKSDGGVSIGDNVHISRNLTLYTTNHNYEGSRLPYDENSIEKPVLDIFHFLVYTVF